MKSHWNNLELPKAWVDSHEKGAIVAFLQGRPGLVPRIWHELNWQQKRDVVLHLCAVGSVNSTMRRVGQYGGLSVYSPRMQQLVSLEQDRITFDESTPFKTFTACPRPYHHPIEAARRQTEAYRASHPDIVQAWNSQVQRMLYPRPNGGKRILPSIYTKLRDTWLRGSGVYQEPAKMNSGHLQASIDLLNESHVNFVDRMTHLLGKMHAHLGNRPDLQRLFEELHHKLEALEVNELYPIVELLASHVQPAPPRVEFERDWLEDWSE